MAKRGHSKHAKELQFQKLIRDAELYRPNSYNRLVEYVERSSKTANNNLSKLEKAGLNYYAYNRAAQYIRSEQGTKNPEHPRFKTNATLRDVDDLVAEAEEIHAFLKSPTHTVRGAQNAHDKQIRGIERLRELGYEHIPTDPKLLNKISRALGNDGLNLSSARRYELMEEMGEILENDPDADIQLVVDRYLAQDSIFYNDILSSWNIQMTEDIGLHW